MKTICNRNRKLMTKIYHESNDIMINQSEQEDLNHELIKLLEQKEYLVNLLSKAVQDQNGQGKNNFSFQDLNEAISLIQVLWNRFLQNQKGIEDFQDKQNCNSIIYYQPYSSIISEKDNFINNFSNQSEVESFQPDEMQIVNFQIKQQDIENMIQDINSQINWLESMINNKGSKLEQSNHSQDGPSFNLAQEQWNQENQLNQQELNQTIVTEPKNSKICSIQELKKIQDFLKKIQQQLKESQQELQNKEADIVKLQQENHKLNIMLTRKERLKSQKQKGKEEPKYYKKSNILNDPEQIFQKIQKECNEMSQVCKQEEQDRIQDGKARKQNQQVQHQPLRWKTLKKVQISSEKIIQNAQKLQDQINQMDEQNVNSQTLAYDYKIFLLMGMLDRQYFSEEFVKLRKESINELWEQLEIPIQQQNNDVIKIFKCQQESYFINQDSPDPFAELNQRQLNYLAEIKIYQENILKIQQKTQDLIQIDEKRKKGSNKRMIEIQQQGLQHIEQFIEQNIVKIKSNIKSMISQCTRD